MVAPDVDPPSSAQDGSWFPRVSACTRADAWHPQGRLSLLARPRARFDVSEQGARQRGFCPRVWTPMESGDGLLVRVRPPFAGLTSDALRELVRLARRHGNGLLEVTRRANLQLRGVCSALAPGSDPFDAGLKALQDELLALGLAAPTLAEEQRQLLLVDPLSGLDPECPDLSSLARQVERALASASFEQELSAKLLVVLDAGGPLDVVSDLRFVLHASEPLLASLSIAERPVGVLAVDEVPRLIVRLLQALAEPPLSGMKRMREVVASDQLSMLLAHVPLLGPALPPHSRVPPLLGAQPHWYGLAIPFGSGKAEQWDLIAALASQYGDGTVRFTSQRTLILPGVRAQAVPALELAAQEGGLIVSESHPLLRVVACTGAPACRSAFGETRNLARALAHQLEPQLLAGATLHVSGCSKSCALSGAASFTVVHDRHGLKLALDGDVRAAMAQPDSTLYEVQTRLSQRAPQGSSN